MDVLALLAAHGAREGTTVVADFQSSGRGRAGRAWIAPPGSALLHSILLRPNLPLHQLTSLSLLVGDAIVSSLREKYGIEGQIKWPNDVLVNGRKISGVLIQTRAQGDGKAVLVGAGINVNVSPEDLPPGATSLLAELGTPTERDVVMRSFLAALDIRYREMLSGNLSRRWESVHRSLAMRDEIVTIEDHGVAMTGTFRGVDQDGALLLEKNGVLQRIVAGDLTRGPRTARFLAQ